MKESKNFWAKVMKFILEFKHDFLLKLSDLLMRDKYACSLLI